MTGSFKITAEQRKLADKYILPDGSKPGEKRTKPRRSAPAEMSLLRASSEPSTWWEEQEARRLRELKRRAEEEMEQHDRVATRLMESQRAVFR